MRSDGRQVIATLRRPRLRWGASAAAVGFMLLLVSIALDASGLARSLLFDAIALAFSFMVGLVILDSVQEADRRHAAQPQRFALSRGIERYAKEIAAALYFAAPSEAQDRSPLLGRWVRDPLIGHADNPSDPDDVRRACREARDLLGRQDGAKLALSAAPNIQANVDRLLNFVTPRVEMARLAEPTWEVLRSFETAARHWSIAMSRSVSHSERPSAPTGTGHAFVYGDHRVAFGDHHNAILRREFPSYSEEPGRYVLGRVFSAAGAQPVHITEHLHEPALMHEVLEALKTACGEVRLVAADELLLQTYDLVAKVENLLLHIAQELPARKRGAAAPQVDE